MFLWVVEEVRRAAYADQRDTHAVPLMLMFDFAEAIDGVSLLARGGAAKNCSQLLRTALEIQMALKYMLEDKSTYEQRCLAYEYYHLRDQLRWEQRCDPAHPVGKQLRAELAGDPFVDVFDVEGREVVAEVRDLEARMNSPRYAGVRAELARMNAGGIRDGGWYGLWDGPKNMRDLAIRLKHGSQYEAFYREWSCVGHGEGAIKRATGMKGDELQLIPLRSPERLPEMCRNACQLCNALTLVLVDKLVPHVREEMRQRYIRDIKPGLTFIDSVKWL
jgi:hypothetical protein